MDNGERMTSKRHVLALIFLLKRYNLFNVKYTGSGRLELRIRKIQRRRDSERNFMKFFLNLELQNTEFQLATNCGPQNKTKKMENYLKPHVFLFIANDRKRSP